MTSLSVVLIAKNQAWNVAPLVESVLAQTAGTAPREIVLVDSASSDNTAARAAQYPITVLRLKPSQPLTPAAGRTIGFRHTTGEHVLFIDGDMALCAGWLDAALAFLERTPRAGGVSGQVIDVLPGTPLPQSADEGGAVTAPPATTPPATEVQHGGGAALYRRAALEQAGGFNPYLHSEEEPELCVRLRHAGWRVYRLEMPMVYHHTTPRRTVGTLIARWRRRLYLGYGQVLRQHVGTPIFWAYLRERGHVLAPALAAAAGLISLAGSSLTRRWRWFGLWALLVGGVLAIDARRKGSAEETAFSVLQRLAIADGTIRGALRPPHDPQRYPNDVEIIQQVRVPHDA